MALTPAPPLPPSDLDAVIERCRPLFESLRGRRLFVTGGSGFFGSWVLESLARADDRLGLSATAYVLTRSAEAFRRRLPHLAGHRCVRLLEGSLDCFAPPTEPVSYVLHLAVDTEAAGETHYAVQVICSGVEGTRRTLEVAREGKAKLGAARYLFTSSGAAFGPQPPDVTHLPDDFRGAPDPLDVRSAYGESKRAAECLCAAYHAAYGVETVVARCFAFVGPRLPLDKNYAVGNFIADALAGGPVRVGGDGRPIRSYLYAADLAVWLWTLLLRGTPGAAYNVGSDHAVSIAELARRVADAVAGGATPAAPVEIAQPPGAGPAPRYVPAIARARGELGLDVWTPLDEAVRRTADWNRGRQQSRQER